MEDKNQIQFRLLGIKTNEFAIVENEFKSNVEYEVATQLGFGCIENEKLVQVNARFVFVLDKRPILIISVSCYFQISQWDDYFNVDSKALTLSKNFAQHISVITVGTARGVLHAKTEGHILNSLILPSINVLELIPNDIVITPNNT